MVNCNEANCTCKMVDCVRHGKCCECIMKKDLWYPV